MFSQTNNEVIGISDRANSLASESAWLAKKLSVERTRLDSKNPSQSVGHCSPWVRAAQLPELFCSWDLAYRCTRNGWLKPVVHGKRRTIYRLIDVLTCMRRIEDGELPPPRCKVTAQ